MSEQAVTQYDDDFEDDYGSEYDSECLICCGEGYLFGYEMGDPLWYDDNKVYPCTSCRGSGLRKDMTWW